MKLRSTARSLVAFTLTTAAALVTAGVLLTLAGFDPWAALTTLVEGAMGDANQRGVTLVRACPLALTGVAVALAFRAGLWNIGAEGQLLAGALAAAYLGTRTALPGWLHVPLLALGGMAAGALVGGLAGWLRVKRGVPEVLSTIMLNFVLLEAVSLAVHGPLREQAGRYPWSDPIARTAGLPSVGSAHLGVLLAVLIALAATLALAYSAWGLRVRALGLGPEATEAAGVAVGRLRLQVMALSGGLAGLAGAVEVQGVSQRLFEAFSPGTGYTAIAVALLARLQPLAVLPSALLFGGLDAGAELMEATQGVPSALTWVVQAVVILASALWFHRRLGGGGSHG